ncbi:MAG: DUF4065 domain-containing protein [Puniceicoccales bacterium]|nr:DUF4065 domain-containing protein [Puniceicoccales bacterium]
MDGEDVNVFDIAKYILHAIGGEISTMKLQKLCYYCQAWSLAWYGKPLFPEDFEAWTNGPVCRDLFDVHKGWFGIEEEAIPQNLCSCSGLNEALSEHVDKIVDDYGLYNGAQLSEISHSEIPWKRTERNKVIPKELMKEYYGSL